MGKHLLAAALDEQRHLLGARYCEGSSAMSKAQAAQTVWLKWECDHGARWTSVKGSPFSDEQDGTPCYFSGCTPGHLIHARGETTDVHCDWFRRPQQRKATGKD